MSRTVRVESWRRRSQYSAQIWLADAVYLRLESTSMLEMDINSVVRNRVWLSSCIRFCSTPDKSRNAWTNETLRRHSVLSDRLLRAHVASDAVYHSIKACNRSWYRCHDFATELPDNFTGQCAHDRVLSGMRRQSTLVGESHHLSFPALAIHCVVYARFHLFSSLFLLAPLRTLTDCCHIYCPVSTRSLGASISVRAVVEVQSHQEVDMTDCKLALKY